MKGMENGMNIIVIVADTFRWDHLSGICPKPQIETHSIEKFSEECVIFDDHYSGSIPTLPNRTDCFTGKFYLAEGGGWGPLRSDVPTLAGAMSAAGYRTQLITSTPHILTKNNYYQRGFQFYEWIRGSEEDLGLCPGNAVRPKQIQPDEKSRHTYYLPGWHLGALTEWMHGRYQWEEDMIAPTLARAASKWLEWNYKDGPFFLWIDCFDPHEPWCCPEYLRRHFDPDYDGIPMTHPSYGPASVFTKRELFNLQANYKAQATFADKWVGHILRKIHDLDLMDDTLIAFTSDHGIYLGEHDRTGKDNHYNGDKRHWPVYNAVSHIPLMFRHPKAKGSRHVKGFTQPIDLTKTLIEAAGAGHSQDMQGISLLPQIQGKAPRGPRQYAVTGRSIENPAINMGGWLYHPLGEGRKPALYRLKSDPMCERNVLAANKAQAGKMRRAIVRFYRDHGATEQAIKCFEEGKPYKKDLGLTVS